MMIAAYVKWLDCFSKIFIDEVEKDGYLKKPNREYYSTFLKRFSLEKNKVIFVDDKEHNLQAAFDTSECFLPFLFTKTDLFENYLKEKMFLTM